MNVQTPDMPSLEYAPCNYGTSRLLFRGPQRALDQGYIACLGSTETFGRFIPEPYPALLEDSLGKPCVNLGLRDAGIDAFLSSPGLIDIAKKSKATVIQVMGAANMSNRLYTVDPRRNQRFIRASKKLKELYPEVSFRDFDLTSHMLTELARTCTDRLQEVRRELQAAWVARMRTLIGQIGGRIVVLWMADHPPYSRADGGTICRDPLFVDRAMLDVACKSDATLVEVTVPSQAIDAGLSHMVFRPEEKAAAQEMLGPFGHALAAKALQDALAELSAALSQHDTQNEKAADVEAMVKETLRSIPEI